MIKLARANQRRRLKTEKQTSRSCLSPLLGNPGSLSPLVEIYEKSLAPQAEEARSLDSTQEWVCGLLTAPLQLFSESLEGVCLDPDSLGYATCFPEDPLISRNPSELEQIEYLEIFFQREDPARGTLIQKFPVDYSRKRSLILLASGREEEDAVTLGCDCDLYLSYLRANESLIFETLARRQSYLLVLEGALRVDNERLLARDAAVLTEMTSIELASQSRSTVLLMDLPNPEYREDDPESPDPRG